MGIQTFQAGDEGKVYRKMKNKSERLAAGMLAIMICLSVCFTIRCSEAEDTGFPLTIGVRGNHVKEVKKRLQELGYMGQSSVTNQYNGKTADAVKRFQQVNGLPQSGEVDYETDRVLFSDLALKAPRPTLAPLNTPKPYDDNGWPERDPKGFLAADGEFFEEDDQTGQWVYLGEDLQVMIRRVEDASVPLVWFETEIIARNGVRFESAMTDPERPGKQFRYPYDIAKENRFVLGFSDDFYATRLADRETVGIIIREGRILFSETNRNPGHHLPNLDMMAQYPDGRLEVYECNEYTAQELAAMGAVNVFSFGPILLKNGEINDLVYTYYKSIEPRHALGMIEPGHYLLISVQGRTKDSKGTFLQRVAEMMRDRGVTEALNLDGGNTMALVFRGRMLNKLATYKKRNFVRTVTSLIGIGHTDNQAE